MVDILVFARKIIIPAAVLYMVFTALIFLIQDRMLFFRQGIDENTLKMIRKHYPAAEEVEIETSGGNILHGWLVHNRTEKPSPLLIYFGGNAEEVSHHIESAETYSPWSLLLVNYRGYGLSTGKPGEKALLEDALVIYDNFSARSDIDSQKIAVMGRSIGCGPAVYLSAERSLAGAVLVSPFASIEEVAVEAYPYLPVRLLLRNRFKMLPYAAKADNPMLALAGSDDRIIPARHSKKLYNAWAGEKILRIINNAGHNDITLFPGFEESIREFLVKIADD